MMIIILFCAILCWSGAGGPYILYGIEAIPPEPRQVFCHYNWSVWWEEARRMCDAEQDLSPFQVMSWSFGHMWESGTASLPCFQDQWSGENLCSGFSGFYDMSILCHHALPGATSAGFPLTLPAQACVGFILRRYMPMPIFGWFGWTENCLHRMRFSVKCFILFKNCLVKPLPDSPWPCLHKPALDSSNSSYEGTCPSLDGLGLRIVHTGCIRKKGHVNLCIQKANSALMGLVLHPTLKNGRNLWSVPWAALRTKCTEAPLPQGLTAHKISGICLRNLLGQILHPHPLEAVSILAHHLPNQKANNCQRLHLSDWSATCFDTWPQSWQRWQLQSLLGYCDVSCINSGGIKMYLGWPVRSICGKVNLFLILLVRRVETLLHGKTISKYC